jgi:fructose-1-phosphate kinase PfkB-like protein
VFSTVGCGDYLLAGFLKGLMSKSDTNDALAKATQAATAKAWSWTEDKVWLEVRRKIKVEIKRV